MYETCKYQGQNAELHILSLGDCEVLHIIFQLSILMNFINRLKRTGYVMHQQV